MRLKENVTILSNKIMHYLCYIISYLFFALIYIPICIWWVTIPLIFITLCNSFYSLDIIEKVLVLLPSFIIVYIIYVIKNYLSVITNVYYITTMINKIFDCRFNKNLLLKEFFIYKKFILSKIVINIISYSENGRKYISALENTRIKDDIIKKTEESADRYAFVYSFIMHNSNNTVLSSYCDKILSQ